MRDRAQQGDPLLVDLLEDGHAAGMLGQLGVQLPQPALLLLAQPRQGQPIRATAHHSTHRQRAAQEGEKGERVLFELVVAEPRDQVKCHDRGHRRGQRGAAPGKHACVDDRQHQEELQLVVVATKWIDGQTHEHRHGDTDEHAPASGDLDITEVEPEHPSHRHNNATAIGGIGPPGPPM